MIWNKISVLIAGLCAAHMFSTASACKDPYERPFGPYAPWNVAVRELPLHPLSAELATKLWNDAPGSRPGNFNLRFDRYTYPVYCADAAEGKFRIVTVWQTLISGSQIPWNRDWQPAPGSDAQVIILDSDTGREWDLWQVRFDGQFVQATNASLVKGDYRTLEKGHHSSRGAGIPYLAMLVRPQEILQGEIRHALSMPIRNTSGSSYVPPATKLEHPGVRLQGIPEGTRFALDVSDEEIELWLQGLPKELPGETVNSARIIARALRDYGWFITDTSGGAGLQFEARVSAGKEWERLGLAHRTIGYKQYPRDLLDGLMRENRIRTIVPSDQYPAHLKTRTVQ